MELWSATSLDGISRAREAARALRTVTNQYLPVTLPATGEHTEWPLIGWAMLARACGTLESVMALIPERRAADAAVLNRTLFEQIVTFAWIAINPNEHPKQWVRWDRGQRIKSDNDLVDRGVEPLLDPDQREAFEAERDSGARMPDNLADRAAAADTHWSAVTEVIHADPTSTLSLRRMYRIIYRNESQFVHAAVNSLDPLIVPAASPGQFRVLPVETSPGEPNPFTNAPVIYGLGLVIGEHALDLAPMEPVLNGLFSSYYGAA